MKKFFISLIILLLIDKTLQSKKHLKTFKTRLHKSKHLHKSRLSNNQNPNQDSRIDYIDKVDYDAIMAKNVEAQKVFDTPETKNGRDDPLPDSIEKELFVKTLDNEKSESLVIIEEVPVKKMVRLNKFTISYGSLTDSYRGIEGGLDISEIIGSDDNPITGLCCEGISLALKQKFVVKNKPFTLYCFNVDGHTLGLKICSEDLEEIRNFSRQVKLMAIKGFYNKRGYGNVNILLPRDQETSWSWVDQTQWPLLCNKGNFQSPLDLDPGRSVDALMTISFIFKSVPKISENKDDHETIFSGDFGKMIHKLEVGTREFGMDSYRMKFPSEHKINGRSYDGEIVISIASRDVMVL